MKRIFLFSIILFVTLISCEKIIDIDLNESDPKLVIEGVVSNEDGVSVRISRTTNYFTPGIPNGVSGAKVTISDNWGAYEVLQEEEPGLYVAKVIKGKANRDYILKVEVDGELYEAESSMSKFVDIDSLTVDGFPFYNGGIGMMDTTFILNAHFLDPASEANHYRLRITRNDTVRNFFYLFDDRYNNGDTISYGMFGNFGTGDSVEIELLSFEEAIYNYYVSLDEVLNSSPMSSAAPKNPISNISNNAIGYFAALASDKRKMVINWE